MNKLESLKLFQDIQLVSTKYSYLQLKNNEKEVEDNLKLKSLLKFYQSRINEITEKCHFVYKQTIEDLKNTNSKDIDNTLTNLNNFSLKMYENLKNSIIESTTIRAVMFSTLDELVLINKSIRTKEYLEDKNTYFYLYEKIVINAFITFLALKDMAIEQEKINRLSQSIFNQIKTLSIISM